MIFEKEIKKIGFLLFKSDLFYLNRIMIYIRIFHFILGYCSYNYRKQSGREHPLKVTND